MTKLKTSFFCQNCGNNYAKWVGQCGACKQWNTVVEEVLVTPEKKAWKSTATGIKSINKPLKVGDISTENELRLDTLNQEFNRVLGGTA
jgi:DNA repair protein RadA/Sms